MVSMRKRKKSGEESEAGRDGRELTKTVERARSGVLK